MFGLDFSLTTTALKKSQPQSSVFSPSDIAGLLSWYDPSDLSTLYQDAAMTTPVTADGDPAGAVLDKSGNNYHLTQSSLSQRPTFRASGGASWIESDGIDDTLSGSLLSVSSDPDLCVATAMRILVQSQVDHRVFELGSGSRALSGAFGTAGWSWRYNNGNKVFSSSSVGVDSVVRWQRNAGDTYNGGQIYVDGSQQSSQSVANGSATPNLSTTGLQVFQSGSGGSPSQIRLYGLVVCAAPNDSDAEQLDDYLEGTIA